MNKILVILMMITTVTFACPESKIKRKNAKKVTKMEHNEAKHSKMVKKIMGSYFLIQKKLVKDKLPTVKEARKLIESLKMISGKCKDDSRKIFFKKMYKLSKTLYNKDINKFRKNYFEFSKVFISYLKKFKIEGLQAYYCPMAKKTWVQNQNDVTLNPYIPSKMLHCGSKLK